MKSLILVVDHNPQVCNLIREYLEAGGYSVQVASGAHIDIEDTGLHPSLVVMGMSVLIEAEVRLLEKHADTAYDRAPWLVLLDSASPKQKMIALDYGADESIVKPFTARELIDCVENVSRRQAHVRSAPSPDQADIVIDSWAMKLLVRGLEVPATTLEFKLLEYMARHPGQVFTRDFLLDAVWGDLRFINPRSVDACIRRIREKIEPDSAKPTMLKTVRGVGYRMDGTAAWQSAPNEICNCPACRTRSTALRFQGLGVKRKSLDPGVSGISS